MNKDIGSTNNDIANAPSRAWVGLDISKQTLDACLLRGQGKPLALADQRQKHVGGRHQGSSKRARLIFGQVQHALDARGQGQIPSRIRHDLIRHDVKRDRVLERVRFIR